MLLPSAGTASVLSGLKRRLDERTLRNGLLAESARPEAFLANGGDGEEAERGSLADFGSVQLAGRGLTVDGQGLRSRSFNSKAVL